MVDTARSPPDWRWESSSDSCSFSLGNVNSCPLRSKLVIYVPELDLNSYRPL